MPLSEVQFLKNEYRTSINEFRMKSNFPAFGLTERRPKVIEPLFGTLFIL